MAIDYAALKKGGFMRQKQKNHFSVRIKVVGGNLTAANFVTISEIADKYGKGYIHLTSRQSVEVPFIHIDDVEAVKEKLNSEGLQTSVCGARARAVTACQGNDVCPSGCVGTYELAEKIDARYFGKDLPHKFKFGVTGCQNNCLKAEENDVGLKGGMEVEWQEDACINCGLCEKVCREDALKIEDGKIIIDREKCNYCGRCVKTCPTDAWESEPGYLVSFGGTFGNSINKGRYFLPLIKDEDLLFQIMDTAIEYFREHGNPSERFKFTLDRTGFDKFQKEVQEVYDEYVQS